MRLKDHYKTLEISPAANLQEIKKAYRRLAFQYHPDTNTSSFSAIRFQEIKEAYDTLANEQTRKQYDGDRWLAGMTNRTRDREIVTPQWILKESERLARHMELVDTYRMSHSALNDYVLLLLQDSHMAILQQQGNPTINRSIINTLLTATRHLKHVYMQGIAQRLALLAGTDNELYAGIFSYAQQSRRRDVWERYLPLIVILATLMLCVAMFLWVR